METPPGCVFEAGLPPSAGPETLQGQKRMERSRICVQRRILKDTMEKEQQEDRGLGHLQ